MAEFTRECFSASTSGIPIALTSSNSAGAATIHACSTNKEEIYLFASNKSTAVVEASIELGDTVSPVVVSISARAGLVPILPGLTFSGITIKGYGSTVSTAALSVSGWVNKIV